MCVRVGGGCSPPAAVIGLLFGGRAEVAAAVSPGALQGRLWCRLDSCIRFPHSVLYFGALASPARGNRCLELGVGKSEG